MSRGAPPKACRGSPACPSVASMEWSQVEAEWDAFRLEAARYWSRLPAGEMAALRGDRASLVQLVKRYYTLERSGAEAQVDAWVSGLQAETSPREEGMPPAKSEEQRAKSEAVGDPPGHH